MSPVAVTSTGTKLVSSGGIVYIRNFSDARRTFISQYPAAPRSPSQAARPSALMVFSDGIENLFSGTTVEQS